MIKIVNKEKYQNLIDELIDLKLDLSKAKNDEQSYMDQIKVINSEYEKLKVENKELNSKIASKNKEIRKLKYLLTKNNVEYNINDKKTKNNKKKVKKGEN